MPAIPSLLDHLIYGAPDLDAAVTWLETAAGTRAHPGGRHPDWGTRNAIFPLGPTTYLEVLGPDPERPPGTPVRLFDLAALPTPRLVAWAAKSTNLLGLIRRAREHGIHLGEALSGQRLRPDGSALSWLLTDPTTPRADGVLPFFIEWPATAHPGATGPAAIQLLEFHAEHPDPGSVLAPLRALGVDLDVRWGGAPALFATVQTPRGILTLT